MIDEEKQSIFKVELQLKTIIIFSIIFFSQTLVFGSDNLKEEGQFRNSGVIPLFCYGDSSKVKNGICQFEVQPGETCYADAMGGDIGSPVTKIPNKTQWNCLYSLAHHQVKCKPNNTKSLSLIAAASVLKFGSYLQMNFDHFSNLMGNRDIFRCNKDREAIDDKPIWSATKHPQAICQSDSLNDLPSLDAEAL